VGWSWVGAKKLAFFTFCGTSQPCGAAGRLGAWQTIAAHTGAGKQCTDAIEAGVGADDQHVYTWVRKVTDLARCKMGTGLPT